MRARDEPPAGAAKTRVAGHTRFERRAPRRKRSPWLRGHPLNEPGTPVPVRFTSRERLGVVAIWAALGLIESSKAWITARPGPQPLDWVTALVANMPWWLMWAVLTPAVVLLARRVRPERGRAAFVLAHVAAGTALSLLHHLVVGTLFYLTRTRGMTVPFEGEMVRMTLALQLRFFFASFFMLNLLTYFAVVGAYYGLEFYKRYRSSELRAARLEAGMQRARLAALQMELNPHFLFNTLNAVAGLVRRKEDDGAVRMLARLSELLRATLEQGGDTEVPLQKELELLGTYLEIERIRFGERLSVAVEADDAARAALLPPLILQPLVENAVRHGVAKQAGPGRILIAAVRERGQLVLTVTNTGPPPDGTPAAATAADGAADAGGGVGLANARERLAELYGARATLTLEPLPGGGACAVIRLPVREDAGEAKGEPEGGPDDDGEGATRPAPSPGVRAVASGARPPPAPRT